MLVLQRPCLEISCALVWSLESGLGQRPVPDWNPIGILHRHADQTKETRLRDS